MTIIAVQGHTMVADSVAWRGGASEPCQTPKIIRAPDGSLVGTCGSQPDLTTLKNWVLGGMDWLNPPTFVYSTGDDNAVDNLWLRPNGDLWRFTAHMVPYRVSNPNTIGIDDACRLVDGMLMARMDVAEAVWQAIKRCAYVGGDLQVERLEKREAPTPSWAKFDSRSRL